MVLKALKAGDLHRGVGMGAQGEVGLYGTMLYVLQAVIVIAKKQSHN